MRWIPVVAKPRLLLWPLSIAASAAPTGLRCTCKSKWGVYWCSYHNIYGYIIIDVMIYIYIYYMSDYIYIYAWLYMYVTMIKLYIRIYIMYICVIKLYIYMWFTGIIHSRISLTNLGCNHWPHILWHKSVKSLGFFSVLMPRLEQQKLAVSLSFEKWISQLKKIGVSQTKIGTLQKQWGVWPRKALGWSWNSGFYGWCENWVVVFHHVVINMLY